MPIGIAHKTELRNRQKGDVMLSTKRAVEASMLRPTRLTRENVIVESCWWSDILGEQVGYLIGLNMRVIATAGRPFEVKT